MKSKFLSLLVVLNLCAFSCDDDASTEFDNANPNAVEKLITSLAMVSAQNPSENTTITVNYDAINRVSSISDGIDTSVLVYDNTELTNITGEGDTFNIEEIYQSPYDAFETGEVLEYDNNGNPIEILFFVVEYDWDTDQDVVLEYTLELSYDSNPNPYFHTMDAAGVIDALDDVQLNFSMNPQSPELVQARMLLPLNNPSKLVYKDENGTPTFEVLADYVYDGDDYPDTATITGTDLSDNQTSVYTLDYTYLE